MAAGDASQTTPEQISHVFLSYYTKCVHTFLIPVITYWYLLINAANLTAVFWVLSLGFSSF